MTYYRGDTRDNLHIGSPKELYPYSDSGGRPKNCKKEIAFADSIGGAVYGATQNILSEEVREAKPKDFLDMKKTFTVYVYQTDKEPTYAVETSGFSSMTNCSTDYHVTGEVRYCDKDIPIKKVCKCDITKHDEAVIKTMLYHNADKEYFDWSKGMHEHCGKEEKEFGYWQSMDCWNAYEKMRRKVIEGDIPLIKKILLKKPIDIPENFEGEYVEGILDEVASPLAEVFGRRCK